MSAFDPKWTSDMTASLWLRYNSSDCLRQVTSRVFGCMFAFDPKRIFIRRRLDYPKSDGHHCKSCFTFSNPALMHSSSTPGEPDRPTPAITSVPTLIGTPPSMAMTLGRLVCSRRKGFVFISSIKVDVVILNVSEV